MSSVLGLGAVLSADDALDVGYETVGSIYQSQGPNGWSIKGIQQKCHEAHVTGRAVRVRVKMPSGKLGWAYRPAQAKE